uniref:Uncharacterized protein n=1 Tax=Arundo donax TaxID=35708 RepID=A0A0A8ZVQ1_ARUDO
MVRTTIFFKRKVLCIFLVVMMISTLNFNSVISEI